MRTKAEPSSRTRALRHLFAGAGAPDSNAPCPDAEQIAAYADQGLPSGESSKIEEHFASCTRCQEVLASVTSAIITESAAPLCRTAPSSAVAPQTAGARKWVWWLGPALATAAAFLWMFLRFAPPQTARTAANYHSFPRQTPAAAASAPASPPPEASPASRYEPSAARSAAGLARPDAAPAGTGAGGVLASDAPRTDRDRAGRVPPQALSAALPSAVPNAISQAATGAAPIQPPSAPQPAGAPEFHSAAPASPIRSAQPQPPVEPSSAYQLAQQPPAAPPAPAAANAQEPRVVLYTFSPPDGSVTWRIGTSGLIQLSTNGGRTWQTQDSGVTADLIAGSAASKDAAWIVGRGGIILRTGDGQHWDRIPGPPGANHEWAAVAAHDAQYATVVGEDLRRFTTTNAGQTWTEQK